MHSLLPAEYWEYSIADVFRGLGSILFSRKTATLAIEGIGNCIPTRSARAAIVLALKALNLPKGALVGIPLYTCPVVIKAIVAAECTPCFIDIDPSTYCISADDVVKKSASVAAIIAIHMFGNLCDMPGLTQAANGKPIIEDCAQALGSMANGQVAGSFGIMSVFSFRSGKYLSAGEGGAFFSRDKTLVSRVVALIDGISQPSMTEEIKHTASSLLRTALRRRPLWGLVGSSLWARYNKKVKYTGQSPVVVRKIFHSDYNLVQRRLQNLAPSITRQRYNADYLIGALEVDPGMLCLEKPGMFYNRYLFPLLCSSTEQRDFLAQFLLRHRIGTIKPYHDIVAIARAHYGYRGGCSATEIIVNRILSIPVYFALNKNEIQRIARYVNEGLKIFQNSRSVAV